jgi:hypothetical protein
MKEVVTIILVTVIGLHTYGQTDLERIQVQLSSRVNTTSDEVNSITALYENYLNSKPEVIQDNPFWNSVEKDLHADFDFSRESMFQGGLTAARLCRAFKPFVMSVEPIGEKYQIRVMYSSSKADPNFIGSKVWCIHKLNAVKENGSWVLENLMVALTKKWESKTNGVIEYVYPPTHAFNVEVARQAEQFCQGIIDRFNPGYQSTFKYFVTSSVDDMGLLENFDYYFVGVTTGKAREHMLMTSKGNEFYAHEIVHKLLPENSKRGYVIEEGMAEFLGTRVDKDEYGVRMKSLAVILRIKEVKINFESVVSQREAYDGFQTAYPAGAGICELVFGMKGDQGLSELLYADTSDYDNLVKSVCEITGLSLEALVKEWELVLSKYWE